MSFMYFRSFPSFLSFICSLFPWRHSFLIHGDYTQLTFGDDEMQIQFVKVLGSMLRCWEIYKDVLKYSNCFEEQLIQLIVTSCQPP